MLTKDIKRIATVRATGQRFLVLAIDFNTDRITLFGNVRRFYGLQFQHDGFRTIDLSEVEISPVRVTTDVLRSLVEEYIESRRAAGATVDSGRRGYTDHGTPREQADNLYLGSTLRLPGNLVSTLASLGVHAPVPESDERIANRLLALAGEADASGQTADAEYILDLAVKLSA